MKLPYTGTGAEQMPDLDGYRHSIPVIRFRMASRIRIHCSDKEIFPQLYKQYVRPHLEYCSQAWSPWMDGDKELLENVKRMVRTVSGLQSKSYEERLVELNMTTLEERRSRHDSHVQGPQRNMDIDLGDWFEARDEELPRTRATADP